MEVHVRIYPLSGVARSARTRALGGGGLNAAPWSNCRYGAADFDHLSLAAFRSGQVSLPDSVKGSPFLAATLDAEAKENLEAGQERMLRSEQSRADIEKREGPLKPYSDPLLVRNRRRYRRFVLDLDQRGSRGPCTWRGA